MASPRKKRRLLEDAELEETALAQRVPVKEIRKSAFRSLSDLLPPAPALATATSSRNRHENASNRSESGIPASATRLQAGKTYDTPSGSTSSSTSTTLLRSALRNGPASFSNGTKKTTASSASRHHASPLRSALPDPFLAVGKKPPDRQSRSGQDEVPTRQVETDSRAGDSDLKPAKLELALAVKPEEPAHMGAKGITERAPTMHNGKRHFDHDGGELSSPRKRRGGGLLANGLAQQAIEVLNRARTDHALWHHALARRITSLPASEAPLSMLRQHSEPDLRLRVVSILPGSPRSGSRLIAQCAILDDDAIPSSAMEERVGFEDTGIVIFSLAMHPSSSIGPPVRANGQREAGAPSLLLINNPADLLLLVPDIEVWVYEPWMEVGFIDYDTLASEVPADGRKALICTRFAILQS